MQEPQTKILQSTDYGKFKFIAGNRSIDPEKVKNYIKMIEDGYSQDECPILVTKDLEILDGQHRFLAAKEKNTPVFYIVSRKNSDSNAMIDINKNNNNWTLHDYVACYSERGDENYKNLLEFARKNKVSYGISVICFGYNRRAVKDVIINKKFCFDKKMQVLAETWIKTLYIFLSRLVMAGEKDLLKAAASFSFLEALMLAKNKKDDFFDSIFAVRSIFRHSSGFKGYLQQFISLQICDE